MSSKPLSTGLTKLHLPASLIMDAHTLVVSQDFQHFAEAIHKLDHSESVGQSHRRHLLDERSVADARKKFELAILPDQCPCDRLWSRDFLDFENGERIFLRFALPLVLGQSQAMKSANSLFTDAAQ